MIARILAADAPNGNWIPGDPNEFYWGTAAFGIIVAVFIWKGLPAVRSVMQGRTARIEDELAAAAAQKRDAEAELAQLTGQLGDADAESAKIRETCRV